MLAARLSEDPDCRVLLLEAGGEIEASSSICQQDILKSFLKLYIIAVLRRRPIPIWMAGNSIGYAAEVGEGLHQSMR